VTELGREGRLAKAVLIGASLLALDFASFVLTMAVIASCWDREPACGTGIGILAFIGWVGVVVFTLLLVIHVLVCVIMLLGAAIGRLGGGGSHHA